MSREPAALVFPATPDKSTKQPEKAVLYDKQTRGWGGPVALQFPNGLSTKLAHPATVKGGEATPAPGKLVFPAHPEKKAPAPLFTQNAAHPLLDTVLRALQIEHAALWSGNETRIRRIVEQLLPLTKEGLEPFGYKVLDDCSRHTLMVTRLSQQYAALNISETLNKALKASQGPGLGLLSKLKTTLMGSSEDYIAIIKRNRETLERILAELRALIPEVREDAERMALHVCALSAVSKMASWTDNSALESAVLRKKQLLDSALSQISLVKAQLSLQEETASMHLTECDRMTAVAMSAQVMAGGFKR